MSEDIERALNQLGSAKADLGVHAVGPSSEERADPPDMTDIASDRILQRLHSPFSATTGADYWSSIYAERAEAAAVIEMLRSELASVRDQVVLLGRRLAEVEAAYAEAVEVLPTAERRGYDLAISQVYEALRRDPSANAASLILNVSEQEPPSPPLPPVRGGATEASRELDEELNHLRRNARRFEDEP